MIMEKCQIRGILIWVAPPELERQGHCSAEPYFLITTLSMSGLLKRRTFRS